MNTITSDYEAKISLIRDSIRDIHDYPKKGIIFRDLTTAFKSNEVLISITNLLYDQYKQKNITKVVGIESRGFVLGSILANKLNAGFIPIRKKGKLPAETIKKTYTLEYGEDTIEIHKDGLNSDDIVLLHDDLLATGGTISAALDLVNYFKVTNVYVSFIVELTFLNGINKLKSNDVFSLVKY